MKPMYRYGIILAVLFTILTLTSSIYGLAIGEVHETHLHLLSRFLISAIGVTGIGLYDGFRHIKKVVFLPIHYAVLMSLVFLYLFATSWFTELHPTAYRDIFFNFTIPYLGIAAGIVFLEQLQSKRQAKTDSKPLD